MGASTAVQPPPRGGRRCQPPWREPPSHQGARGPASEGAAWGPRACAAAPDSAQGRKMEEKVEAHVQVSFSLESGASPSAASCPLTVLSCGHCP